MSAPALLLARKNQTPGLPAQTISHPMLVSSGKAQGLWNPASAIAFPGVDQLTFLILNFLLCKMGMIPPSSEGWHKGGSDEVPDDTWQRVGAWQGLHLQQTQGHVDRAISCGLSLPTAGVRTQKGKQENLGWPLPTT